LGLPHQTGRTKTCKFPKKLPSKRWLLAKTRNISARTHDIRTFVGVNPNPPLDAVHKNKAYQKHNVLQRIDEGYMQNRIDVYCSLALRRLNDLGLFFEHAGA